MKIQIAPKRILKDVMTVWHEHGPEVDVVMDPKLLTFRPGSVEAIYAFHVLDHLFPEEVRPAIANWHQMLAKQGRLLVVVDDFEYISRAFVGGDISIELVNDLHNHPTQFSSDSLFAAYRSAGFEEDAINRWLSDDVDGLFKRKHYEIVFDAKKHG